MIFIAGSLPGHIARSRGHPWAQAVLMAGWITLFFGFALWPLALIWAYVDAPAPRPRGSDCAMIVAIFNVYLVILFGLVKLEDRALQPLLEGLSRHRAGAAVVRSVRSHGLGCSPAAPPSSCAIRCRSCPTWRARWSRSALEANRPVKAGGMNLSRIDPVPFPVAGRCVGGPAQARGAAALADDAARSARPAGRAFDVQQHQASVEQLKAQIEGARWNLEQDGGARPCRRLRDQSRSAQGRTRRQPAADTGDGLHRHIRHADRRRGGCRSTSRFIRPGQPVELTFKFLPGQIHRRQGRDRASGDPQADRPEVSGRAITAAPLQSAPFVVRVKLDDEALARRPAGRQRLATAAIFTEHVKVSPRHPQGPAAADRDPELRQPVLRRSRRHDAIGQASGGAK